MTILRTEFFAIVALWYHKYHKTFCWSVVNKELFLNLVYITFSLMNTNGHINVNHLPFNSNAFRNTTFIVLYF